jgi:ankyrin repeat protein
MLKSLPSRPNLEQLKKQAKDLLKVLKAGDPAAKERFVQALAPVNNASFSLGDAQSVIAREYGFASWRKLKHHVEELLADVRDPMVLLKEAFNTDDAIEFRRLLERFPYVKAKINEPVASFDSPLIIQAKSREMLDVLLEAGADINAKSRWWAGGFGILHGAEPGLATYAIQRGAAVDAHAAARLGKLERLQELVHEDPAVVHARGGDGQTPLHFASSVEIARFLLDHGAEIDACDVDHESTPAQYMLRDRQEVARYLVRRGCKTDLLMAAALGDLDLVRKHLQTDPQCIHMRVSHEYFPMSNPKAGGTILQWTLGWYVSPHQVARQFGHAEVFALLMSQSPADVKLIAACWDGDESSARAILASNPGLVANLSETYRRQIAHAARNNNTLAVQAMLAAGLPVDAVGQHWATPLHWAAFHGNAEMTRRILAFHPPLEATDRDFNGTPLGWAIHGSQNGWYCTTGDYASTVELLLAAGATPPDKSDKGSPAVQEVLSRYASAAGPGT